MPKTFFKKFSNRLKKMFSVKKIIFFVIFQLIFGAALAPFIIFWGPFQTVKVIAVGSVMTSRHPQYLKWFLSEEQVKKIQDVSEGESAFYGPAQLPTTTKVTKSEGVEIQEISGKGYKGKIMLIKDPRRVQVAYTSELEVTGERVSDLVKNADAVGGINAGGFDDPNGKGNGGFPMGTVIHEGKIVYDKTGGAKQDFIGIDNKGKMIIESMTPETALSKGIMEAIYFFPQIVKDGKGVVTDSMNASWGLAPRTAIGQLRDGTIMLVVIDGRQPLYSLGAYLRDVEGLFLQHGAVIASNLDGGSSTTMYYDGKVINKPCDIFGERYVPTGFIVKP